jgi:hypothetical protein
MRLDDYDSGRKSDMVSVEDIIVLPPRRDINDAMQGEIDEAKQEAKEDGQRWSDVREEWLAGCEADNWGDAEEAEFDADFRSEWERRHGKPFPTREAAP